MSTLPELIAARDAALIEWYAAGPASLSAEADVAWTAYKAASAAVERARNLPIESNPLPPPPPPDVAALAAEMVVATLAAQRAEAVFVALDTDDAATLDQIMRAWDVAAAAGAAAFRACQAYRIAAKWEGVRAA